MDPPADHGEQTYQGHGLLKGRVALVTGGDSGIGRAICLAFAREGADVAISYWNENADAEVTEKLVRDAGQNALLLPGDIRDSSFCKTLVNETMGRFGQLDILVNNAAYQETKDSIEDFSDELFDQIFKTNVYAIFYLCKAAMQVMQPGSSIINTASIQGYDPSPMLLPYAASKSAVIGMTKSLSKLAMDSGIRVNAVAPGPVWTPLIPSTMPEEQFQNFGAGNIYGRPAQPAELAPVYVWLASQLASYISGEVYGVTGGETPV